MTLEQVVDYMDSGRLIYQVYYDRNDPFTFGVVEHVDPNSYVDFSYDPDIFWIWCSSSTTAESILCGIEENERMHQEYLSYLSEGEFYER